MQKNTIRIPKNTLIIYSNCKQIITLTGPIATKSLKVIVKLTLIKHINTIEVTSEPLVSLSNDKKKQIRIIQGSTAASIKQLLMETTAFVYKKLRFVGVGYRALEVGDFKGKLLMFKLGFSHPLYYRISGEFKLFCLKFTRLYVYGCSYQNVTQAAAVIRLYKKPEPYKGKGILYFNEKIKLKEGKKA